MHLATRQGAFTAAIFGPTAPRPPGVTAPAGCDLERRFNIYRNNVIAGLTAVLRESFPVVSRLVGGEFFSALACSYVRSHPPTSPVMSLYGHSFPDFLKRFAPAAALPYLGDVAQIEWAWIESYHSADSRPKDQYDLLRALSTTDMETLQIRLHPSLRVVQSVFPAWSIWRMHGADEALTEIELDSGSEEVLMVRPVTAVETYVLPKGGAAFVGNLRRGCTLASAVDEALGLCPNFDLAATLKLVLRSGAIVEIDECPASSADPP